MIRYTVRCENGHAFESWFASAEAFDSLLAADRVACPDCGVKKVSKTLMAPSVRSGRKAVESSAPKPEAPVEQMTNAPDPKLVEAIRTLRAHVEKNSDYVGDRFAKEARAMHEGEIPHRPIYGEARPDEAKKLHEDGVPALPLPFVPKQKTN